MLLPLVLVMVELLWANRCMATENALTSLMAEAQTAAKGYENEVKSIVSGGASAHAVESPARNEASCPIGECAAVKQPLKEGKSSPLLDAKKPLIFVSSSMPRESLKKLAYQAVQHNAHLVIRGMVRGSMVETAKLVDAIDCPLEIDPTLFARFKIVKVPVFMVYHNDHWHQVSGNVDLNFAHEKAHTPSTSQGTR